MHLVYLHTDYESPLSEIGFAVVHQAVVSLPPPLSLPLSNTNTTVAEEAVIRRIDSKSRFASTHTAFRIQRVFVRIY